MTVAQSLLLYVAAALTEIGGSWLMWQGIRGRHGAAAVALGIATLAVYGLTVVLQPQQQFGRILAGYGGVFIAGSLVWGAVVDGFRPDRWDVTGALMCLAGVAVIAYVPGRG
jgi:small multidrug resistance family-3 protein